MINIQNNTPQILLSAEDRYFVDLIQNRITLYGQIPYTIPEKMIIEIIRESARLFYRYSFNAGETLFYRLPKEEILKISDPDLQYANFKGYGVNLPGFVNVVQEIYQANIPNIATTMEILTGAQFSQQSRGINNSLYIIENAARLIEQQNLRSIIGTSIPFTFSRLTHRLMIYAEVACTLMLKCICNVNVQILYNDDLFIRHTIGRTKQELKRLIAGHLFPLPGGVTLSAEEICNNLEDVEKVEELLKNSSGIGDIILQRD